MMVKAMRRPLTVKAKALRRQHFVPAVIYGAHLAPIHISIPEKDLEKLFAHVTRSTAVEVQVDETETHRVFVKDIQLDPITERFLHLDLYVAEPGRTLTMEVPVKALGTARGLKDGGILDQLHSYIPVRALPEKIPARIEVDVSNLGVGDSILIRDLPWPEGVQPLFPPEDVVVTVLARRALEVAAPVAAAAPEAAAAAPPTTEEGGKTLA